MTTRESRARPTPWLRAAFALIDGCGRKSCAIEQAIELVDSWPDCQSVIDGRLYAAPLTPLKNLTGHCPCSMAALAIASRQPVPQSAMNRCGNE